MIRRKYFSYAKINLILKIKNLREDNYHNISTLMQRIHLYDTIYVEYNKREKILRKLSKNHIHFLDMGSEDLIFSCDNLKLLNEKNKIIESYQKMRSLFGGREKTLFPLHIHLKKRIPIAGGLGGSSTNGAKIIQILNHLWSLKLKKSELYKIGSGLGSDFSFFLSNYQIAQIENRDQLKKAYSHPIPLNYFLLLVYPNFELSSKSVYQLYKNEISKKREELSESISKKYIQYFFISLEKGEIIQNQLANSFKDVLYKKYPELNEIEKSLLEIGAQGANLSGSGSVVYGIFKDLNLIQKSLPSLQEKWPNYSYIISFPS